MHVHELEATKQRNFVASPPRPPAPLLCVPYRTVPYGREQAYEGRKEGGKKGRLDTNESMVTTACMLPMHVV
jgi:hypothetical protein